jgi:hypothetical protein
MQQTVFEVNASTAEPLMTQLKMKHKSRIRCIVSAGKAKNTRSWYATIWNTLTGENAMRIAERLIRSLLNRKSDGVANGIKQTRTVF